MLPRFEYDAAVRVVRNLRNDGTYPGLARGSLLVRRGSVGYVVNVGTFLQDQLIYSVHFPDADRIVGCREEELLDACAPWTPSRYEARDKVRAAVVLAVGGETRVPPGTEGEVMRVIRDGESGVRYHVLFPGQMLQVPEWALRSPADETAQGAEHG